MLNNATPEYRNLKYLATSHNLTNFIDYPPRVTETSATCTDLIMNFRDKIVRGAGVIQVGCIDHSIVFCQRKFNRKRSPAKFIEACLMLNFNKYNCLADITALDWSDVWRDRFK